MNMSDLTTLSKVAIGLAIAGSVASYAPLSTSSVNGVVTCDFMDYGKVVLGGLTILVGGLGEVSAMRLTDTKMANMIASGGASLVGIFHLLVGLGIVGGPC